MFISFLVELDRAALFQGIVASTGAISACIGPVIGGVLTDRAGWSNLTLCGFLNLRTC